MFVLIAELVRLPLLPPMRILLCDWLDEWDGKPGLREVGGTGGEVVLLSSVEGKKTCEDELLLGNPLREVN